MKKCLASIILLFLSSQLYAAELKIGIVNMNVLLQKSTLMASLNEGLVKDFETRQNDLNNMQKKLLDEKNKLNVNASNMTNDDRIKLQNKIAIDQANLDIETATLQRDLAIAKEKATQQFTTKMSQAISSVAQSGNYDMIQQNTSVLFIKPELDVTQQVLNAMK